MTFPCKMKDIVSAEFRTEWYGNDLPPSPYQNVAGITNQVQIYIFPYLRQRGEFPTMSYFQCDFQLRPFKTEYATYFYRAEMTMGINSNNHFIIEKLNDYSLKITWNYIDVDIRKYDGSYSSTSVEKRFGPSGEEYTPWLNKNTRFYISYLE